jgi:hypothetical protein
MKKEGDVPIRVVQRKATSLITFVSWDEYILSEGGHYLGCTRLGHNGEAIARWTAILQRNNEAMMPSSSTSISRCISAYSEIDT